MPIFWDTKKNYHLLWNIWKIYYLLGFFGGFFMVIILLVGCFGLNGPLRQYFSLYRAVSQREGERKEDR